MLKVSTPAAVQLAHLLHPKAGDAVVRIVRRKNRLRLRWSLVRPGDETFAHDGRVVLALDDRMRRSLSKRQLDVRQTDAGPRLRMKTR
jgi:hypothetical protein